MKPRMEMLKLLTQKLRQQSLNEVQPFQQTEVVDRDSGTESDEENIELQAHEEAQENRGLSYCDRQFLAQMQHQQSNAHSSFPTCSPTYSVSYPIPSVSRRPLQLVNHPNSPFHVVTHVAPANHSNLIGFSYDSGKVKMSSTDMSEDSSDYERCSHDYEPDISSSSEFDSECNHSSEEELVTIINNNIDNSLHSAEKRKWSQVNRCGSCNGNSGSSDDEVKDLLSCDSTTTPKPVSFGSSPPCGVQRFSRTMSPRLFFANVSPIHICSVSPRKRHRQTVVSDITGTTVISRPCLDFEKMQKIPLFKKHVSHGVNKARVVKIKSFNGHSRPPKGIYDPSIFSFRSISMAYSPLTPVEEPPCAF